MADEGIPPERFHEVGWRVLAYAAATYFRTASFAEGMRLADVVGHMADGSGYRPDIDVRPNGARFD
jgi:hypothetical protein